MEKFFRIQWTASVGWIVVSVLLGIIFATGCAAGLIGNRIGRVVCSDIEKRREGKWEGLSPRAVAYDRPASSSLGVVTPNMDGSPLREGGRRGNPAEDVLNSRRYMWVPAIVSLALQFAGDMRMSAISLGIWMISLAIGARSVLKSIWWPKFWIVTVIVSLVCGFILAWQFGTNGASISIDWLTGGMATAKMLMRGLYVFSLVNWATRSVRREEFMRLWENIGMVHLGNALTEAYGLLPHWLDRMNAMISARPVGMLNNIRYIKTCAYICILDAVVGLDAVDD